MSHPNTNTLVPSKPSGKDDNNNSGNRKNPASKQPQEAPIALKCPRCDSPNTKFCYYNNYSLTQPRHFCKTCRRYWTRGGALRNVPIGGGCRKNKKMKSSSSVFSTDSKEYSYSGGSSHDHHHTIGGLKFFQGISPAMDFQLNIPNSSNINNGLLFNNFASFGNNNSNNISSNNPCLNFDGNSSSTSTLGFGIGGKFPNLYPEVLNKQDHHGSSSLGFHQEMGSNLNNYNHTTSTNNHLASSIESLSSINQDLHWKLQQQRLSMLFVGDQDHQQKDQTNVIQKPLQPILFRNLEIDNSSKVEDQSNCAGIGSSTSSRKDHGHGTLSTEWFFDNTFANATHHVNQTPVVTNASSNSNNENGNNWSSTGGVQAWSDLTQFSSLP